MDIFAPIGARLREERERLGLSQTDAASIAESAGAPGATRQSQALYEKGKRMPDAAYLASIAAAGADVLYILTGQRGSAPAPALAPDEAALLDNYRHCPQEGKQQLEAASALYAQLAVKKKRA
jgi:transcriptional regulator with XRE-family HTH domain